MSNLSSLLKKSLMVALALTLTSSLALAQDEIDPQADAIAKKAAAFMATLQPYTVEVSSWTNFKSTQSIQQTEATYKMALQKPDNFSLLQQKGSASQSIVINKKEAYIYSSMFNQYQLMDAPESMIDFISPGASNAIASALDQTIPFFDAFIADNPYDKLMADISVLKPGTDDKADGVDCSVIDFKHKSYEGQLFIQKGDKPFLKQIVINISANDITAQFGWTLKNWSTGKAIPASTFNIAPPANASKVGSFGPPKKQHPMLGEMAPNFKMNLLSGGTMELEKLRDNIVILDFWATWCGPCRKAMPEIIRTVKELNSDKVKLFAVNDSESEETIKSFITEAGHDVEIAYNKDSANAVRTGGLYQVKGIPTTVIIDKKGQIQGVHVGFGEGTDEQLKEEVEALLEGKSILPEIKKETKDMELAVTSAQASVKDLKVGQKTAVTFTIKNNVDKPVPANKFLAIASAPRSQTFFKVIDKEIPANGEVTFTIDVDCWNIQLNEAGTIDAAVTIDPYEMLSETDRSNNNFNFKIEAK